MNSAAQRSERTERRFLGALRFLDAVTGLPVTTPLRIEAEGVDIQPNRRGFYIIHNAPGLEAHRDAFRQPPNTPPEGSVEIDLHIFDRGKQYLPRCRRLTLPRPSTPGTPGSIFEAEEIPIYLSPLAPTFPNWSVVRADVVALGDGRALPGSLIRVLQDPEVPGDPPIVLARALGDWRGRLKGEALVAIPGIPVTTWGDSGPGPGPVLVHEISATLEVVSDPDFDWRSGAHIPDPDVLEANIGTLPTATLPITLAAGRSQNVVLEVDIS